MPTLTTDNKKAVGIVSIILLILFYGAVCWFVGKPLVNFASKPEAFRAWIDGKGVVGQAVFVLMVAFQVVFAVIPGEPLEIGAGYAFGSVMGTMLCLIGAAVGSIIVFLAVKKFGKRLLDLFFDTKKINDLKFLGDSNKLDVLAFLIFFIPGTPKDVLTYFFGLTKMKTGTFILITTIARVPSVVTSAVGGSAIGEKNYFFAIIVFVVTLLITAAGALVYKLICKYQNK